MFKIKKWLAGTCLIMAAGFACVGMTRHHDLGSRGPLRAYVIKFSAYQCLVVRTIIASLEAVLT